MKKIKLLINYCIFPLALLLSLNSCGSQVEPKPYVFHSKNVDANRTKAPLSVMFFKQELELPSDLLTPKVETSSSPYLKLSFTKPTHISKILLYQTGLIEDNDGEVVTPYPRIYSLIFDEATASDYNASYYYDPKTLVKIDELNSSSKRAHLSMKILLSDFLDQEKAKEIHLKKHPSVKVEGYVVEDVVMETLQMRSNLELNEALVQEIAHENEILFRLIQKRAEGLQLPENSLADLPSDVSVRYALKHHQKILKSNRYKANDGKYKKLEDVKYFDSSYKYKSSHKAKVNGKKVRVERTAKKHKVAKYIDFSKGI